MTDTNQTQTPETAAVEAPAVEAPAVEAPAVEARVAMLMQTAVDAIRDDADTFYKLEQGEGEIQRLLQSAAFIAPREGHAGQVGSWGLWEAIRIEWSGAYHLNQRGAKPIEPGGAIPGAVQKAWDRRLSAMRASGLEGAKPAAPNKGAQAKAEQRSKAAERVVALLADITPDKPADAPADAPAPRPAPEKIVAKAKATIAQAARALKAGDAEKARQLTKDAEILQKTAETVAKEVARKADETARNAMKMARDALSKATEGMTLGQLSVLVDFAQRLKLGAKMSKDANGTITIEEPTPAPV